MPITVTIDGKEVQAYLAQEVQDKVDAEVAGLKATNANLKAEKTDLKGKLDTIEAEKAQAELDKAKAAGDLDKVQSLLAQAQAKEAESVQALLKQIKTEKVSNTLNSLVNELGAGGVHNEDLKDLINARFQFDNDNETGAVKVSGDNVDSIEKLKTVISESGRYDSYLAGSKASGGGSNGSKIASGAGKKFNDMTEGERLDLFKTNPDEFNRLKNA